MLISRAVRFRFLNPLLAVAFVLAGCSTPREAVRTQFRSFNYFEGFQRTQQGSETVLLSPRLDVQRWDELIVSWNADCPPGTALKIEACAFGTERTTRFYEIARWSAEPGKNRTSIAKEADADAAVDIDTLVCKRLMNAAQLRLTLSGTNGVLPQLKFIAASFLNSTAPKSPRESNRHAWGKTLDVPQRSQLGYPGGNGWCSPTCVSMLLAYWSRQLNRPELDVPVPEVAQCVRDTAYRGAGNWAFNMAYAGSFDGMRAYATRFNNLKEVEDCIAKGFPVALSVSFDLLNGKEADQNNGHLIVVVGFTEAGDVVVNDPWPNPKRENSVRKTFLRERVIAAWQRSKQTVYVIAPEQAHVPQSL
jgi:uncharacterized protein YvpB